MYSTMAAGGASTATVAYTHTVLRRALNMDTYSHVLPNMQAGAVAKLDGMFSAESA